MSHYVRDASKESGLYALLLGEKDGLTEGQARGIAGDLGKRRTGRPCRNFMCYTNEVGNGTVGLLGGPGLGARIMADDFQIARQELNPREAVVKLRLKREQNWEDADNIAKTAGHQGSRRGSTGPEWRDTGEGSASR